MTKLIAVVIAGLFTASTMFAGGHDCCATKVANDEKKMACEASLADLSLTADQKTKMEAAMADHHKAGCNKASEAKYMKDAKGILTADQYKKFEMECKGEKEKTKA